MNEDTLPAMRAWPRLAAQADRDPHQTPEPLHPDGSVLRFGDVVVKHAPRKFQSVVRAHRQASRLLKDHPLDRAVPFMGFDAEEEVLLLGHVPGKTVADRVFEGADPERMCFLVGRWLATFHKARERKVSPFHPEGPLSYAPLRSDYLPEIFARERDRLEAMGAALKGMTHESAVLHGDFNAHNLIVDGDIATGIDFGNLGHAPTMRDAGQVLAAIAVRAETPPGEVFPPAWRAAFERGYGPSDQLLDFFVLQRLLLIWGRLPARSWHLGRQRKRVAHNIAAMFPA